MANPAQPVATLATRSSSPQKHGLLWLTIVAYVVMLHWTYEHKVAPVFAYLGSRYREPDMLNYLIAIGLCLLVARFLPRQLKRPSDVVVWIFYVMAVVPAITVPQYADIISARSALNLAMVVAANFVVVLVLVSLDPIRALPRLIMRGELVWFLLGGLSLVIYAYLIDTTDLEFNVVSFADVQDVRFAYRDQVSAIGPLLGYLVQIQGNVLNPLFITKGALSRRWPLIVLGAVGQVLIYSLTGYKLVLLSVPALLLMTLLFRKSKTPAGRLILVGTFGTALLALILDWFRNTNTLIELFIDRLLLMPGTLTAAHVMVFEDQPKALWAYSFMGPFVENPYTKTPAYLVGQQFSGNSSVQANANLFADGYANFGYIGISIEAFALVLLLWALNGAARHLPLKMVALMMLVPSLSLVNGSVFTNVLTGGFAFTMMIMLVLPSAEDDAEPPGPDQVRPNAKPAGPLRV